MASSDRRTRHMLASHGIIIDWLSLCRLPFLGGRLKCELRLYLRWQLVLSLQAAQVCSRSV